MSELPARGNADVDQLLGTLRGSPSADKHPNSHLKSSDFLIIAVFQLKPLFLETQYVGTNWQPSVGSFWFRVVSTTMWSWPRKAERSRNKAKWCCQMGANNTKIKGALVRVRISTLMSIKQLHWAELPDPAFLMFPRLSQLPLSPDPDPTPHCPESRLSNNFAIPIGKAKP